MSPMCPPPSKPPQPPAPASAESPHPSAAEKRVGGRAAITLKVDYKRINTFFADYTKNISKGGTFIRTTKPLPVGTEFVFVLCLPTHNEQLRLLGEVVWVTTEQTATATAPAGMGIRFKFKDDAERDGVARFVESLMSDVLGAHIAEKLIATKPTAK